MRKKTTRGFFYTIYIVSCRTIRPLHMGQTPFGNFSRHTLHKQTCLQGKRRMVVGLSIQTAHFGLPSFGSSTSDLTSSTKGVCNSVVFQGSNGITGVGDAMVNGVLFCPPLGCAYTVRKSVSTGLTSARQLLIVAISVLKLVANTLICVSSLVALLVSCLFSNPSILFGHKQNLFLYHMSGCKTFFFYLNTNE